MRVTYRVLGELTVSKDGELCDDMPTGRAQLVLAALLISANRRLSVAELLRVAWDRTDVEPIQLQKRISTVRKLLIKIGRRDRLITYRLGGYELKVAADELDSLQFHRLVLMADDALASGRIEDEIVHRRAALALWQGPHVVSNVDNIRLRAMAAELEARRVRTAVRLAELEFGRGNHEGVLSELAALTGYYPTDRRLCELMLIAQYRTGHGDAADATFERHKQALSDFMGTQPERAVRALNYAISQADDAAIAEFEAKVAVAQGQVERAKPSIPRQLPNAPGDFVGQDEAVAETEWLLSRGRTETPVVAICGPGGTGKTALALHVAHHVAAEYPDGQLFADLRGSTAGEASTEEIVAGFLRAFGVTRIPETLGERVPLYRTLVAGRKVLVVLDDARDEEQVRDLIPGNPECAVLVTARRKLPDLDGVHHSRPLVALTPADAATLFHNIAQRSRIEIPARSEEIERIVALCAGLPLALRIVAYLYVQEYPRPLDELADRLARHGAEAIEYGSRSLARSIGAGFDRLSPDAQRLFLGLALTKLPEFELWTAAAVLDGTGADPGRALAQLVSYHMVEPVGSGLRHRFHDLTRDYAHRRAVRDLATESERRQLVARTYRALLSLARQAHAKLCGGEYEVIHSSTPSWQPPAGVNVPNDGAAAWEWFERERTNIRAGVDHTAELADTALCWDLALSAQEFYALGRYFDDWHTTHTVALQACQIAEDHRGEAIMLASLGQPALVASRPAGGISGLQDLERAIDLLRASGDEHGLAIAQRTLAHLLRRKGQLARALSTFTEALRHYEASHDALGQWQTLRFIGQTHLDRGHLDEALRILGLAWQAAEQLGRPYPLAQTSYWLGQAHLKNNDLHSARTAFATILDVFDDTTTGTGRAYALHASGDMARLAGDTAEAATRLEQAAQLAGEASDATLEGRVNLSLATLHQEQAEPDAQIVALERAIECFAGGDVIYLQAVALSGLSQVQAVRGDHAAAEAASARVTRLYADMDLPEEDRIHHASGQI
jgi:DNA-binding SARP family transcriptional activator